MVSHAAFFFFSASSFFPHCSLFQCLVGNGRYAGLGGGGTPFGLGSSSDVSGWTTRKENTCGQKGKPEAIEIRIVSRNPHDISHVDMQHRPQVDRLKH